MDLGLLGQDITSARSSDTYMTVCRIVLQGGGGACQCYKLMLRRVSAITNRTSCTDSYMMTLGNWNGQRRQYRQWCNNAVVYQNWQIWSIISGLWKRDARWPICYSGVWQLLRLNIYVMYDMYNVPGVTMMAWAPLILPVNCLSSPPYHPSC